MAGSKVAPLAGVALLTVAAVAWGPRAVKWLGTTHRGDALVRASLEDRRENGAVFSASTQSFLRDSHALDKVTKLEIFSDGEDLARLELIHPEVDHDFRLVNVPLRLLVPRLHYETGAKPDSFDAFNLMLAEFSRNGLSVPVGAPGDRTSHFETNYAEAHPWTVTGPFEFEPNPRFRPVRVSVINNCLRPGLWELSGVDRAGELYHSWFEFPEGYYYSLIAEVNGVDVAFARAATTWTAEPAAVDLERLRAPQDEYGEVTARLAPDEVIGFSSQGSRRKLERGFAKVGELAAPRTPESRRSFIEEPVLLNDFVEPGKYSLQKRKRFELGFLGEIGAARVRKVRPKTRYSKAARRATGDGGEGAPLAIELELELGPYLLVLGNLPLELLVPQEDFALHGFGVGVLSSAGLAERRKMLVVDGPAPSFAYLLKREREGLVAVNTHAFGIEQVFIRTKLQKDCVWEVTVTSFERIVDLVKYEVAIPAALQDRVRANARSYVSPLYFTYRDDNLR